MTDLPPGWEWVDLADVAVVQGGIQKQAKRRPVKNKYPFLRVANVHRESSTSLTCTRWSCSMASWKGLSCGPAISW